MPSSERGGKPIVALQQLSVADLKKAMTERLKSVAPTVSTLSAPAQKKEKRQDAKKVIKVSSLADTSL